MTARAFVIMLSTALVVSCSAAENGTDAGEEKGKPVFEDTFDKGMENWQSEGPHTVEVKNGRLCVKTPGESKVGQYVWCRHKLPSDFRLEWDVTPLSKSGFFLVFFCVEGTKGEDVLGKDRDEVQER